MPYDILSEPQLAKRTTSSNTYRICSRVRGKNVVDWMCMAGYTTLTTLNVVH